MTKFRTQKAAGLHALAQSSAFPFLYGYGPLVAPGRVEVLPYGTPFIPAFVRPCPVRPRHGFVDSQRCDTWRQVCAMVHAQALADPEGEIIFMQPLDKAPYSAVVTKAGVAFGKGNDGATSGRKSVFVPASCRKNSWDVATKGNYNNAGIENSAYLELVADPADGRFRAVQLRDGPNPPTGDDYIPCRTQVLEVVRPNPEAKEGLDDLLAWEELVLGLKDKPGVVVWLPGGTLASHYAIHAIVAGIPVVTGAGEPKLGSILERSDAKAKPMVGAHYRQLANLVAYWLNTPITGLPEAPGRYLSIAVGAAHSHALWGPGWHLNNLRAFAAAMIARHTIIACLGEARHFYRAGPGARRIEMGWSWPEGGPAYVALGEREAAAELGVRERFHTVPWHLLLNCDSLGVVVVPEDSDETHSLVIGSRTILSRKDVFTRGYTLGPAELEVLGRWAEMDLCQSGWDSGYGGGRWADAAKVGTALMKALLNFVEVPSKGRWEVVAMALNAAVNAVHNGGPILNKWLISKEQLDNYSRRPQLGLSHPFAASLCLDTAKWSKAAAQAREMMLAGGGRDKALEFWSQPPEPIGSEPLVVDFGEVQNPENWIAEVPEVPTSGPMQASGVLAVPLDFKPNVHTLHADNHEAVDLDEPEDEIPF